MSDEKTLSLWRIDETIRQLVEMRDDPATTEEERLAIDGQLSEWAARELSKVDRIRAFLRFCDIQATGCEALAREAAAEVAQQKSRAEMWTNRAKHLKEICIGIMESRGVKWLEGESGRLRLQNNGGKRALNITNEGLIPDELCVYRGVIRSSAWTALRSQLGAALWDKWSGRQDMQMTRAPLEEAVRQVLETKCALCGGSGEHRPGAGIVETCSECNGTGHKLVPGAELKPRGVQLRVE